MSPRERRFLRAAAAALTVLVVIRIGAALMSTHSAPPRFAPCPGSPNCVSSQATDEGHAIAPLGFEGTPERAREALLRALSAMPRTRVKIDEPLYLRAECRSLIFRFVDDLELLIDPEASVVHVRSASRVGYSDLGVNRRRVEALRAAFAAEVGHGPPSGSSRERP